MSGILSLLYWQELLCLDFADTTQLHNRVEEELERVARMLTSFFLDEMLFWIVFTASFDSESSRFSFCPELEVSCKKIVYLSHRHLIWPLIVMT